MRHSFGQYSVMGNSRGDLKSRKNSLGDSENGLPEMVGEKQREKGRGLESPQTEVRMFFFGLTVHGEGRVPITCNRSGFSGEGISLSIVQTSKL